MQKVKSYKQSLYFNVLLCKRNSILGESHVKVSSGVLTSFAETLWRDQKLYSKISARSICPAGAVRVPATAEIG